MHQKKKSNNSSHSNIPFLLSNSPHPYGNKSLFLRGKRKWNKNMFYTFKYLHYLAFCFFLFHRSSRLYKIQNVYIHVCVYIYKSPVRFCWCSKILWTFLPLHPPHILIMPVLNFSTDLILVCSACSLQYAVWEKSVVLFRNVAWSLFHI